jgi:hypothetical protein
MAPACRQPTATDLLYRLMHDGGKQLWTTAFEILIVRDYTEGAQVRLVLNDGAAGSSHTNAQCDGAQRETDAIIVRY